MVDHKHSVDDVLRFCNQYLDAPDVVCIDEVGFYVGDHGKYGYSQIGKFSLPGKPFGVQSSP
jgi:hypothetical protein